MPAAGRLPGWRIVQRVADLRDRLHEIPPVFREFERFSTAVVAFIGLDHPLHAWLPAA
jgi:hypothetical protein